METNTINFKFPTGSESNYILTLDGKEIGRVYELEIAEMIEEVTSRKEIATLELQVEKQKEDIEKLEQELMRLTVKLHDHKKLILKINTLTTPTIK